MLSSEFWPKDLLGAVEDASAAALHPKLQHVADAFTEQVSTSSGTSTASHITRITRIAHLTHLTRHVQYKLLKRPRTLKWRHSVGVVSITCTMEDGRVVQLLVQPLHVSLLLLLQVAARAGRGYCDDADEGE